LLKRISSILCEVCVSRSALTPAPISSMLLVRVEHWSPVQITYGSHCTNSGPAVVALVSRVLQGSTLPPVLYRDGRYSMPVCHRPSAGLGSVGTEERRLGRVGAGRGAG